MKNLFLISLILLFIYSCKSGDNTSKQDAKTEKILTDSSKEQVSNNIVRKTKRKDTAIIKNLDDCITFYKNKEYEVNEFLDNFELLEIPVPYYQLKYMNKTTHNSFFLVYAYTIEYEEGLINLILCDSTGTVLDREYISQIYEYIKVGKKQENLYRVYGKNLEETDGISDNLRNTGLDSEYDFDFYVNTRKIDTLEINN